MKKLQNSKLIYYILSVLIIFFSIFFITEKVSVLNLSKKYNIDHRIFFIDNKANHEVIFKQSLFEFQNLHPFFYDINFDPGFYTLNFKFKSTGDNELDNKIHNNRMNTIELESKNFKKLYLKNLSVFYKSKISKFFKEKDAKDLQDLFKTLECEIPFYDNALIIYDANGNGIKNQIDNYKEILEKKIESSRYAEVCSYISKTIELNKVIESKNELLSMVFSTSFKTIEIKDENKSLSKILQIIIILIMSVIISQILLIFYSYLNSILLNKK